MRHPLAMLACLCLGAATAQAAPPDVVAPCVECHTMNETGASLPQLEGQQPAYLRMQLTHFRERNRQSFPMSSVAHDLSDAEIGELAGWFAAQPWDAFSFDYDPRQVVAGAKLVSRFQCASCHTASFTGSDVVPRTAGQNPVYLARQLRAFAAGTRYHPPTGTGARMFRLQPDEIDALAQFLAQLGSPDPAREP